MTLFPGCAHLNYKLETLLVHVLLCSGFSICMNPDSCIMRFQVLYECWRHSCRGKDVPSSYTCACNLLPILQFCVMLILKLCCKYSMHRSENVRQIKCPDHVTPAPCYQVEAPLISTLQIFPGEEKGGTDCSCKLL